MSKALNALVIVSSVVLVACGGSTAAAPTPVAATSTPVVTATASTPDVNQATALVTQKSSSQSVQIAVKVDGVLVAGGTPIEQHYTATVLMERPDRQSSDLTDGNGRHTTSTTVGATQVNLDSVSGRSTTQLPKALVVDDAHILSYIDPAVATLLGSAKHNGSVACGTVQCTKLSAFAKNAATGATTSVDYLVSLDGPVSTIETITNGTNTWTATLSYSNWGAQFGIKLP